MKDKQKIQHKVEETLNSIDGVKQALANPYLFTRIKAKLDREKKGFWIRAFSFISRPAIVVTAIVIVIFINAAVFLEFRSETGQQAPDENEQVFANEYNLSSNTIYDATIEQQ
jgi:hypothetical protein